MTSARVPGEQGIVLYCRSRCAMKVVRRLLTLVLLGILQASGIVRSEAVPKRLLIVGQGPDGHPATTHEFMAGAKVLAELLKPHKDIQVTLAKADEPWSDGPKMIDQADGIVMFVTQGARWMQMTPERHAALRRLAAHG